MPGPGSLLNMHCPLAVHPLNLGLYGEWGLPPLNRYVRTSTGATGDLMVKDLVVGRHTPHDGLIRGGGTEIILTGGNRTGGYGAVKFTGVSGTSVNMSTTMSVSAPYSTGCWFNPASLTGALLGSRGPGDHSLDIQISSSTLIHGDIGDGTIWLTTAADATVPTMSTGTWYHVMYVVTSKGYTIYFNGVQVASGAFSGAPLLCGANNQFSLGNNAFNGTNQFTGMIDEAMIYNRELSSGAVSALYQETKRGNPYRWNWEESGEPAVFGVQAAVVAARQQTLSVLGCGV